MKQHNKYNDEELYQRIMAELKPGADEYDMILEHKRHKNIGTFGLIKWAACIVAMAVGFTVFFLKDKPQDNIANNNTELTDSVCSNHQEYSTPNLSIARAAKEQHSHSQSNVDENQSIDILPEVEVNESQEQLDEITVSPRLHHDLP